MRRVLSVLMIFAFIGIISGCGVPSENEPSTGVSPFAQAKTGDIVLIKSEDFGIPGGALQEGYWMVGELQGGGLMLTKGASSLCVSEKEFANNLLVVIEVNAPEYSLIAEELAIEAVYYSPPYGTVELYCPNIR